MLKKPRKPNTLYKETFVATLAFIVAVFIISLVPFKSEFMKPVKQEFDDFDIYDLFYAGKGNYYDGTRDKDIYIVQAADTRADIARQLEEIKMLQPRVIGVDLSFAARHDNDAATDSALTAAITGNPAIVQGYTILTEEEGEPLIKEDFLPKDYLQSNGGYINFSEPDTFSVIRSFAPFYKKDGKEYTAFTSKIAERYDPAKFARLKARHNSTELINYHSNIDYYTNYSMDEFDELFKTNQLGDIKGKIVLLGVFTKNDGRPRQMEDVRFSPLNSKPSGRSFPDVYGVVIHANIISMILQGNNFVTVPPLWASYVIGFIVAFGFIHYILHLHKKHGHPKHIALLLVQIPGIILIIYFFLKFFDWFKIKVTLSPIVLLLVLSMEMIDLYIILACWLNKKFKYETIFATPQQHHNEHENA